MIDIGTKYLRVGYSGNDRPSVVVPTVVGTVAKEGSQEMAYFFDDLALYVPRPHMKISPVASYNDSIQ